MTAEAPDSPSGPRVPVRVASPPPGALSTLDPFERFLLDEIDGKRTIEQLAGAVMGELDATRFKLDELVARGLVAWLEVRVSEVAPKQASVAAAVELEPERRARIDVIHAALPDLTHYELLGVRPDTDKALIKRAYFMLSKEFHPDTQYGKQLGAYKSKMEIIFRHLTEAHDVLTRAKRKTEYDEELVRMGKKPFAMSLHPALDSSPAVSMPVPPSTSAMTMPAPPTEVPAAALPTPTPPAVGVTPLAGVNTSARRAYRVSVPGAADTVSTPRVPSSATPVPAPSAPKSPAPPVGPAAPISSTPPSARAPTTPTADRALFRAIAGASQVTGRVDRLDHYLHMAHQHEAKGDLAEALSCAKLALGFDPTRSDTKALHDRLDRAIAHQEAETCRARAKAEEKAGKVDAAAVAWIRVCLGRPDDVEAHLGAARCLLDCKGDLRKARDFGQRAVEIAPHSLQARVVLARIFHAAGMRLNATRELEAAAKLDPGSQLVKTLQRELK